MKVLVETSARHVHLSREDAEALFGKGRELTFKRELSQPGQFVCEEKVEIVGPRDSIKGAAVLGPFRERTQVEISSTDARKLGISAPIRESGDLGGSAGCRIIGPAGERELSEGVIVAQRHVHASPADAEAAGISDGSLIGVKVTSKNRSLIFGDVLARVSPNYSLAFHIDVDESNAAGISPGTCGEILPENVR